MIFSYAYIPVATLFVCYTRAAPMRPPRCAKRFTFFHALNHTASSMSESACISNADARAREKTHSCARPAEITRHLRRDLHKICLSGWSIARARFRYRAGAFFLFVYICIDTRTAWLFHREKKGRGEMGRFCRETEGGSMAGVQLRESVV